MPYSRARVAAGDGGRLRRPPRLDYTTVKRNSSGLTVAHDAAGNITSIPVIPGSGASAGTQVTATATWDAFNRPVTITGTVTADIQTRCDAFGRRICKWDDIAGFGVSSGRWWQWLYRATATPEAERLEGAIELRSFARAATPAVVGLRALRASFAAGERRWEVACRVFRGAEQAPHLPLRVLA
jgi:YD repeat-containing protein